MTSHPTVRSFARHEYLSRNDDDHPSIFRVKTGWAGRFQTLDTGRRQFTDVYLPGEWCDPRWAFDPTVKCQIVALTGVTAEIIPVTQLYESRGPSALLIKKMIGAMIRSMAYQDDRIICLGSKNAMEIVASILLNLYGRTHEDYASDKGVLVMPLTQSHLADLAGMTHVHMNRTLMKLKYIGLIQSRSSRWILPDLDALKRLAQGATV